MNHILYCLLPALMGVALAAVGNMMVTQRLEGRTIVLDKHNKLLAGFYLLFPVGFVAVALLQQDRMSQVMILQLLVGFFFICVLAVIDMKSMIIPNKILLVMLGVWAGLKLAWVALDMQTGLRFMLYDLSGGVFVFIVFGLVYLVTKRQLGGGDVKLATVMGLYLSQDRIMGGVLYGVLACATARSIFLE